MFEMTPSSVALNLKHFILTSLGVLGLSRKEGSREGGAEVKVTKLAW